MRSSIAFLLALGLGVAQARGAARAEEPAPAPPAAKPAWAADLDAWRLELAPLKRAERQATLLAHKPDARALLDELACPQPYPAGAEKGMRSWEREVPGVGPLTVFAYVPSNYTTDKAWPALVWLHGGVSRDGDGAGMSGLNMLQEECEAKGVLLVSPSATKDCVWWSPKGAALARGALRDLATLYRVDPLRTAVAGFSDGASGGLHMLAHDPDAYGCVMSLMGNPLVTRLSAGPSFHPNLASLPVIAFNGGRDGLYPSAAMKPFVDEMIAAGARITWSDVPEAGHNPAELGGRWDEVWPFWEKHPREALPPRIDWESVHPEADGRRSWVEILEVRARAAKDAELPSRVLKHEVPPRPRLGIRVDTAYTGAGLKIEAVEDGTPAAEAGMKAGDVIVAVGETTLATGREAFSALQLYLPTLAEKDGSFRIQRGEETLTLSMRPRAPKPEPLPPELGYGKPSGRIQAEVKGPNRIEVRTRGVARLRLHLARPLVDTQQEVTVVVNGVEAWKGRVTPEPTYVLAEALRSLPGDPLFEGQVTLTVAVE